MPDLTFRDVKGFALEPLTTCAALLGCSPADREDMQPSDVDRLLAWLGDEVEDYNANDFPVKYCIVKRDNA